MANKQTTICKLFRKCEKARDNASVVIEIDSDSSDEGVSSKSPVMQLPHAYATVAKFIGLLHINGKYTTR